MLLGLWIAVQVRPVKRNTVLWCKPDLFRIVLRCVLHRGYSNLRVCMHGSSDYDGMAKGPFVFDPNYNTRTGHAQSGGFMGHGTYIGSSDHVPSDFHITNGGSFPKGTCVLVLMFTKPDFWNPTLQGRPSNIDYSKTATIGAYEQ